MAFHFDMNATAVVKVTTFKGTFEGNQTIEEVGRTKQELEQRLAETIAKALEGWNLTSVEVDTKIDWREINAKSGS